MEPRITYQDILDQPELLRQLAQEARRERAEAMGAGVRAVFMALAERTRRPLPTRLPAWD